MEDPARLTPGEIYRMKQSLARLNYLIEQKNAYQRTAKETMERQNEYILELEARNEELEYANFRLECENFNPDDLLK